MDPPEGSDSRASSSPIPSGTVTFLFTDIEASTSRWERGPTAMGEALRRHDKLLRATFAAARGFTFKTVGDAFCCAFSHVEDALVAARAAQLALGAEDFSAVDGLSVRMAIHVGVAEERDNDYFGPPVNRVARLLSLAHGGQILLSEASAALARAVLPHGCSLIDLGIHRLKDLALPEHVFEFALNGIQQTFPPLSSLDTIDNNLPFQLTRILGRADDLAAIEGFVRERRCVTLVGTGGVGKTRVALQAAANLLDAFPDGVWFANLATVAEASYVATAVAAAVGAPLSSEGDVVALVLAFLRKRRLLIVLDNCEHVIGEAARVVDSILDSCGEISVLATSREPLNLRGESVHRLGSLPFPKAGVRRRDDVLQFASCALFVERATTGNRAFVCDDTNAGAIAEICRRLDGIPLAIELAAARTRILSPRAIAARLDERFALLTGGARSALPRQQTMRALIDWSYELLDPHERLVFRRCAVFAGSWTVDAADAVCRAIEPAPFDVVDTLSALADKSLIVVNVDANGHHNRFALLESMRAYALEKLDAANETDRISQAQAHHVAGMLEASRAIESTSRWLAHVGPELDNILTALSWTLGTGNEAVLAGQIAAGAGHLWFEGGFGSIGRRFIESVLAKLDARSVPALASRLWQLLATLRYANGTIDAAQNALLHAQVARDRVAEATARMHLGFGLWQAGRAADAETEIETAIALHREAGAVRSTGYASTLDTLGSVFVGLGRLGEARRYFSESLAIFAALDYRLGAAVVAGNLAELEFAENQPERALERVAEAIVVFRDTRATVREATLLVNSAAYLIALRRVGEARREASRALYLGRRAHEAQIVAVAIQHLATVAALDGDVERGALLIGYVDAWYRNEGYEREHSERDSREVLAAALRESLSQHDVERLNALGASLGEEDAAREAGALAPASAYGRP